MIADLADDLAAGREDLHQGYAAAPVPEVALGSGWRVFFIVGGSLCGLPAFLLSASVFGALGLAQGLAAVLIGTTLSAMLGAMTASTGSRSRAGLAVLVDRTFDPLGAAVVKLAVALSLTGWFGVEIGVLGSTASATLLHMADAHVPPLVIDLPVCIAIAVVTIAGAKGLELLGKVLVPISVATLVASVVLARPHAAELWALPGTRALGFGQAVSAIVGSYVVGILIQPDYGRFVRRPLAAAVGAAGALGVAYPVILALSSIASLATRTPELISAMILLGYGAPALAVLVLGIWIDASACLYSASLSLVNQFPRSRLPRVVVTVAAAGMLLVLLGVYGAFVPFLVSLGIALPPLATVLVYFGRAASSGRKTRSKLGIRNLLRRSAPTIAWAAGTATGIATTFGVLDLTRLPTLDSIIVSALTCLIADGRRHRVSLR